MRRIFVGDLQGCHDELCALLDAVRFDPAADRLYAVGDLINRGPKSAACVRTMRDLGATVVLGNHELHYFELLAGRRVPKGRDTMDDLLRAEDRDELNEWLKQRPLLHVEDDLVMVHAGVRPGWAAEGWDTVAERLGHDLEVAMNGGPTSDDLAFAVRARFALPDGSLVSRWRPKPEPPAAPWDAFYDGDQRVIFGHWAQRGLVQTERVLGLDTGCVYGQELTAWIAEEERVVQVPAVRAWCPTS